MASPAAPNMPDSLLSSRLSPQEQLAASRKALVRHMTRDARTQYSDAADTSSSSVQEEVSERVLDKDSSSTGFSAGTLRMLKRGLRSWWRHHPANFAVSVVQPLLGRYASQSPFRLLVISAGVGAALVVIKPWRLVSMGGLALATLKSSEFSGLLMSMLSSQPDDNDPAA